METEREKSSAAIWAVSVFGAAILYLLAPAPIWKLLELGVIPRNETTKEVLTIVFHPLDKFGADNEWIGVFYQWWFRLWGRHV